MDYPDKIEENLVNFEAEILDMIGEDSPTLTNVKISGKKRLSNEKSEVNETKHSIDQESLIEVEECVSNKVMKTNKSTDIKEAIAKQDKRKKKKSDDKICVEEIKSGQEIEVNIEQGEKKTRRKIIKDKNEVSVRHEDIVVEPCQNQVSKISVEANVEKNIVKKKGKKNKADESKKVDEIAVIEEQKEEVKSKGSIENGEKIVQKKKRKKEGNKVSETAIVEETKIVENNGKKDSNPKKDNVSAIKNENPTQAIKLDITINEVGDKKTILEYMIQQNRPYSAINIYDNLHGNVKKAECTRILDQLSAENKLLKKEYNQNVYIASQMYYPQIDEAEKKKLDIVIEEKKKNYEGKQLKLKKIQNEFRTITSKLTDEELIKQISEKRNLLEESKSRLMKYKDGGYVQVPDEEVKQKEKNFENVKNKYKKVRKVCVDVVDGFCEPMEMKRIQVMVKFLLIKQNMGLEEECESDLQYIRL